MSQSSSLFLGTLSAFDAMLFHMRDMNDGRIPLPKQKNRQANQRYIMFLMESPKNDGFPYQKFANYFNWTMTFRRDSDFHRPYGWVQPKGYQGLYAASGDPKLDLSTFQLPSDHQFQTVVGKNSKIFFIILPFHKNFSSIFQTLQKENPKWPG